MHPHECMQCGQEYKCMCWHPDEASFCSECVSYEQAQADRASNEKQEVVQ